MSTVAPLSIAQMCADTPTVEIKDNRGLAVRSLQYNRNAPADSAQQLISQQCYGVRGELLSSIDPRLFIEQQLDPRVLPNFRYHTSLSGQVLRSQSQDAGDQVLVYDVEKGPVWQADNRGQIKRVAYDVLHRPISVFEQDGPGARERVSERYVYGENEVGAVQANARGQIIRHYDTAGLNAVPSYSCTAQPLRLVRQLLSDASAFTDWQGSEPNWAMALDAEQFRTQLGYNALGDGIKNVDARGNQQQQQFNVAGQLASSTLRLSGQVPERPMLTSILYSAAGQVLQEVAGNGVRSVYSYEAQTQRLSRLLTTRPGQPGREPLLQDLTYSYDPVGNILSIGNAAIGVSYHSNQRIEPTNDYQYDALYQLISASGRENASAGQQGQGLPVPEIPISVDPNEYSQYTRLYTYDRGCNLTQIRHQGRGSYTLAIVVSPSSNRAVHQSGNLMPSDVDAYFDACGNLTQLAPGQPLYWNGRNQLQRVVQVTRPGGDDDAEHYQYDGGGQRARKTTLSQTSGTRRSAEVIYLPGLELRRTRSSGGSTTTVEDLQVIQAGSAGRQQVRLLHWEIGRPVDIPNDQLRGSLDNQIGSSVLELDQEANLLTLEEYFPYGGTAAWSGRTSSETQYKFVRYSGKELDATGLYYYGYRYYAPWLGRWLNPDPAGTIDGPNLFEMVRNNPVVLTDSNGLAPTSGDPTRPMLIFHDSSDDIYKLDKLRLPLSIPDQNIVIVPPKQRAEALEKAANLNYNGVILHFGHSMLVKKQTARRFGGVLKKEPPAKFYRELKEKMLVSEASLPTQIFLINCYAGESRLMSKVSSVYSDTTTVYGPRFGVSYDGVVRDMRNGMVIGSEPWSDILNNDDEARGVWSAYRSGEMITEPLSENFYVQNFRSDNGTYFSTGPENPIYSHPDYILSRTTPPPPPYMGDPRSRTRRAPPAPVAAPLRAASTRSVAPTDAAAASRASSVARSPAAPTGHSRRRP